MAKNGAVYKGTFPLVLRGMQQPLEGQESVCSLFRWPLAWKAVMGFGPHIKTMYCLSLSRDHTGAQPR